MRLRQATACGHGLTHAAHRNTKEKTRMKLRSIAIGLFIAATLLGSQLSTTSLAGSHRTGGDTRFTVRIENISSKDGQTASDGTPWPFALSPGIWVAHDRDVTLFT